jgi:Methyltransferase FkbM domain
MVHITSLDREDATRSWPSPDFVKIDAEGEEHRILAGGHNFFARHSPLIMFEIKAGDKVNEHLRALFPTIGYRLFRQLGGAPILVPDDAQQPVDGYELNMFAAKPDLVSALSHQGLLVDAVPAWMPSADNCKIAESFWRSRKFAPQINLSVGYGTHVDSDYCNSLAAYATWRAADRPVAARCAALAFALGGLRAACARVPTAGRLSTLARVAWEWGARGVLQRLIQILKSGQIQFDEPFGRRMSASTAWSRAISQPIGLPGRQPNSLSRLLVFRPYSAASHRFWRGSAPSRLPAPKWNVGASWLPRAPVNGQRFQGACVRSN